MPLRVHVDVGHRPELNTDELWQIVQNGLGDQHEIVKQGHWYQVPNVIVKRSDSDGAAIQTCSNACGTARYCGSMGLRPRSRSDLRRHTGCDDR